ncbi:DNA repair protein rad10 [Wolfiporia cocos MD-104 SS10]|uniref:DNA repair protein rad10 n=1 Tax=Wolfiporia cocos (strain MD-104) TaxID=742152 RepID=A0A2H3K3Q5_WOLCO|nr:DNA repair protein rad10 [Wolfiporia cocos MD-104 SS10]
MSSSNLSGAIHQGNAATSAPKPPVVQPGSGNNIIVNPCQRGNPILECIRNVGKEFGDIVADYQVGRTTGVLFLRQVCRFMQVLMDAGIHCHVSLRYHRLHPEYIYQRIERLGHSYNLRVLLLMCDVSEHQDPIKELTKVCLINNITIMVAWNAEEAGYYLSTYKQFEHKPPDMIKERVDKDYHSMLRTALTSISKVNKTDVETLRTSFGSFTDIARATSDQLQNLPGFGQVKAKRIRDAFERPFRNNAISTLSPASWQVQSGIVQADKGKGKERDTSPSSATTAASDPVQPRRPREPSPVWDIELDLNPTPSPPEVADTTPARKRPPSPVWDIELDLNDSDPEESQASHKKRRTGESFGQPLFLQDSP